MNVYHASTRGKTETNWLESFHSYSFAEYVDPEREQFGALRVLNDDVIAPGKGFGVHSHQDMEIITIMLDGAVEHQDSTGSHGIVKKGEVQVMSAGTGVLHSEMNASSTVPAKLLQIWILPNKRNLSPRYDQKMFNEQQGMQLLVSSDGQKDSLMIHQDVLLMRLRLASGKEFSYEVKKGHGLFTMVISGSVRMSQEILHARDAAEITEHKIIFKAASNSDILLIQIPL